MRLAYFTNQYPATSHTFIRREVRALETHGEIVLRYALRPGRSLVDQEDEVEAKQTQYVLQANFSEFFLAFILAFIKQPLELLSVIGSAISMGWRSERGVLRHLVYVAEALVLARWCQRDNAEHIHAHFGTNSTAVAMLASRLSRLPYSFTAHGSEEFEKAPLLSLNAKLSEAKFAVCVSSFGRAQLMRWTRPKNWEKISVVHCGLDQVFLNRESIPVPDNKRFVCVGRLDEHKAQIVLIAAARLLKEQNLSCQIILVGDGYWRGEVEKAIEQAGLQDKIVITGWVTGEEVKRHIESSRALVLPSFSENMPVVIMEALALGRPVISTFVAGIPELVHPGKNGWLVPAGDVTALADAMKEALTCPLSILSDMGQYGRDHVTKNHDANTEAAKLKKLFLAHAKSSLDLIIKSS